MEQVNKVDCGMMRQRKQGVLGKVKPSMDDPW